MGPLAAQNKLGKNRNTWLFYLSAKAWSNRWSNNIIGVTIQYTVWMLGKQIVFLSKTPKSICKTGTILNCKSWSPFLVFVEQSQPKYFKIIAMVKGWDKNIIGIRWTDKTHRMSALLLTTASNGTHYQTSKMTIHFVYKTLTVILPIYA